MRARRSRTDNLTMLNITIPVQTLRGLSIRRGVTPGSWTYPGSGGASTTYDCAAGGAIRALERRLAGERIGSYLPPAPGCFYSYERALACPLP